MTSSAANSTNSPTTNGAARSATNDLLAPLTVYLDDVAARAADRLEPTAGVAITLGMTDVPLTIGASTDLARDVDLIQYEIGKGPCLHALHHGVGMYVPDLASDTRWGEYGARAAARGAKSCISVPVFHQDEPAAVFKVYAGVVDGLTEDQQEIAKSCAPEVAGGIGLAVHLARQARTIDDRVAAMSTRRVIDLAVGIVMERLHTDADSAFALLRKLSQTSNVKLRDAAASIVAALPAATSDSMKAPFRDRRQSPGR
jgi:GAF domain-containing protein